MSASSSPLTHSSSSQHLLRPTSAASTSRPQQQQQLNASHSSPALRTSRSTGGQSTTSHQSQHHLTAPQLSPVGTITPAEANLSSQHREQELSWQWHIYRLATAKHAIDATVSRHAMRDASQPLRAAIKALPRAREIERANHELIRRIQKQKSEYAQSSATARGSSGGGGGSNYFGSRCTKSEEKKIAIANQSLLRALHRIHSTAGPYNHEKATADVLRKESLIRHRLPRLMHSHPKNVLRDGMIRTATGEMIPLQSPIHSSMGGGQHTSSTSRASSPSRMMSRQQSLLQQQQHQLQQQQQYQYQHPNDQQDLYDRQHHLQQQHQHHFANKKRSNSTSNLLSSSMSSSSQQSLLQINSLTKIQRNQSMSSMVQQSTNDSTSNSVSTTTQQKRYPVQRSSSTKSLTTRKVREESKQQESMPSPSAFTHSTPTTRPSTSNKKLSRSGSHSNIIITKTNNLVTPSTTRSPSSTTAVKTKPLAIKSLQRGGAATTRPGSSTAAAFTTISSSSTSPLAASSSSSSSALLITRSSPAIPTISTSRPATTKSPSPVRQTATSTARSAMMKQKQEMDPTATVTTTRLSSKKKKRDPISQTSRPKITTMGASHSTPALRDESKESEKTLTTEEKIPEHQSSQQQQQQQQQSPQIIIDKYSSIAPFPNLSQPLVVPAEPTASAPIESISKPQPLQQQQQQSVQARVSHSSIDDDLPPLRHELPSLQGKTQWAPQPVSAKSFVTEEKSRDSDLVLIAATPVVVESPAEITTSVPLLPAAVSTFITNSTSNDVVAGVSGSLSEPTLITATAPTPASVAVIPEADSIASSHITPDVPSKVPLDEQSLDMSYSLSFESAQPFTVNSSTEPTTEVPAVIPPPDAAISTSTAIQLAATPLPADSSSEFTCPAAALLAAKKKQRQQSTDNRDSAETPRFEVATVAEDVGVVAS